MINHDLRTYFLLTNTTNTFYRSVVVVLPFLVSSIHSFGISDLFILPKGAKG